MTEPTTPAPVAPSARTTLKRRAFRGHYDDDTRNAILDGVLIGHLATVVNGEPRVLPTAIWRIGDEVIAHGAKANALLGAIAKGAPCVLSVAALDALVFARSAFHHSVNYRSVVVFGHARVLETLEERRGASMAFLEKVCRGRSQTARPPTDDELQATLFLALPLNEASAKIRTGPPRDSEADLAHPCWTGIVPVTTTFGVPELAPDGDRGLEAPTGPFTA